MIYVHFRALFDPAYESFCRIGETLDCETAVTSRFAHFLSVPLAFWGLAGAAAMAALAGTRAFLPLATAAAVASLALAAVSAFVLRVLCPLCAAAWAIDFALFALALRGRREAVAPTKAKLGVATALFAAVAVTGFLSTPRVSPLSAWREGMHLAHGVDAQGHPWLGAEKPALVVEEFVDYTCPHCRRAHARLRAEVERNAGAVRLVRHDFPRSHCLPLPLRPEQSSLCLHARVAHCAVGAGRFWEASDWLFSRPETWKRPDLGQAARIIGVREEDLRACIARPETYQAAEREHQHGVDAGVRGTPAFAIGGKLRHFGEVLEAVRATR
jgi:uncharacterized membrane protein